MAFIDIKDPRKRDEVVADYLSTIKHVQQRNENDRATGFAKQVELENTFQPVIRATEKSTEAITKELKPLREKINEKPRNNVKVWNESLGIPAIEYYLKSYNETKLDKYYGIQRDEDDHFEMGEKRVYIDGGSNITVDDIRYEGTPGLWSLIMLGSPLADSYDDVDLTEYQDLVTRTGVVNHPLGVKPGGRPKQTVKYRLFEIIMKEEVGSGIKFLPSDIKGLSTKLNLLLAEYVAGNRATRNEIVGILDELLRRGRLSRKEYSEINTYLAQTL